MTDTTKRADAQTRGFTNDGKVNSEVVNDSYGTVDPADSTGLDTDSEQNTKIGTGAMGGREKQPGRG